MDVELRGNKLISGTEVMWLLIKLIECEIKEGTSHSTLVWSEYSRHFMRDTGWLESIQDSLKSENSDLLGNLFKGIEMFNVE